MTAAWAWGSPQATEGDPHLDTDLLPRDCATCHASHGEPGSPMLPAPQAKVCLSCHGTRAGVDQQIRAGTLASQAQPALLSQALAEPYTHPLDEVAFSRYEAGVVTCTSCHSPHRGSSRPDLPVEKGRAASTRSPTRPEFELCQSCHRNEKTRNANADVGVRMDPRNPSYHPVESFSGNSSPSLRKGLSGVAIDCTDCHGNDDAGVARGPHGSSHRFLLRAAYATMDGALESVEAYALCYRCHERERVLRSPLFPEHYRHVVELEAACATCHDAHGSIENRALIRFGQARVVTGVSPSATADVLAFDSSAPGSGSCYLTCHGYDHAPATYGGGAFRALEGRKADSRQRRADELAKPGRGRTGRSADKQPPP